MKAYTFKFNKNTNKMGFTDAGRHWVKYKSNELREVTEFFKRKDLSIRVSFADDNGQEKKIKVRFRLLKIWMLGKGDKMQVFDAISTKEKNFKGLTIEFPLMNGNSIFVWHEKGLVFYGKDRNSAKLIDRTKVKFDIIYVDAPHT